MTPFAEITQGIWEAKRIGREGPYNLLVKVYGDFPFFEVSVWDYDLSLKGELAERVSVRDIAKLKFGDKIKDLGL